MNSLFGLSMTYIAGGCVAATAVILLLVAFIAVRNPVMFKMGLRNIPRRPAQTALIIVGLMLSTVIMSAAFGTGDTLTNSVTSEVYSILGPADEIISWDTDDHPAPVDQQTIPLADVEKWRAELVDSGEVKAVVPYLREYVPVSNPRTRLNEPFPRLVATRPSDLAPLGGLRDVNGSPVELGPSDIAVNEELADNIDARVGDTLNLQYKDQQVQLAVKAILPNTIFTGTSEPGNRTGAAVSFDFLAKLTGRVDKADFVAVSNDGTTKGGEDQTDAVMARLDQVLAGSTYEADATKHDLVRFAELIGNIFTTIFVVFGLFSIAAGILLIFLIFVMLAAERKPEMGMARAVGAKRWQLVESFLAEGMGYDLGSALVGLVAGIGVTYAMVGIISWFAGESLGGLNLAVTFSARSLVTAFCLGVIATFIVIFISSYRASRLNITSAIRDLPESHPVNPEAETWYGYGRALLNGVIGFGLLVGLAFMFLGPLGLLYGGPLMLIGLISPWANMLRGSDFGQTRDRRIGAGLPKWPWIVGIAVPFIGWFAILPWYCIAVLLVRITRDRKPAGIAGWLLILGIIVPPLGFVLTLLQRSGYRVSWSTAGGSAFGLAGIACIFVGVQAGQQFPFMLGVSLTFLWAAIALRHFHVHERLSFSVTSLLVLSLWYLAPAGYLDWLTGELSGDIEMFFLSGMVMVTCGVFIVIYNADILLPAIGSLGSRFGRIMPAIRTGVAYPLTSRFRTGMTMAMIGLIMFALVVNAAINKNFSSVFLNEDSKGGFDILAQVNGNNRIDDFRTAVSVQGGPDVAAIEAVAEVRIADASEAEVQNLGQRKNDDDEIPAFVHDTFYGVDAGFLATTTLPMQKLAAGYSSDKAIWEAMAKDPSLAVLTAATTAEEDPFGPSIDVLKLDVLKDGFQPFQLQIRDPGSNQTTTITVIGQLKSAGDTFFQLGGNGQTVGGIIVGKSKVVDAFPGSKGQRYYLDLGPDVDAKQYAKQVEATLVQASADSLQKLLDDQQSAQNGFLLVFQGFMGLGLIVGIAALGVVASRAVVERRQQIGMLRAIGYQRRMVALSFLFESGFIALSGIILGLGLGLSLAWVLFTSGNFGEESKGVPFLVPWVEVGIVASLAFVASMIMTYLPARAASRVAVAEALRYE